MTLAGTSVRRLALSPVRNAPDQVHADGMTDREEFLAWVRTALYEAELALHNGESAPRRALWSRNEPVSVLGAWRNVTGVTRCSGELAFSAMQSYSREVDHALSGRAIIYLSIGRLGPGLRGRRTAGIGTVRPICGPVRVAGWLTSFC